MTQRSLLLATAALAATLCHCSSSSSSSSPATGPICAASSFELDGTLDGASAAGSYAYGGYAFINALGGSPGTLMVPFGTGGELDLTWSTLVADDATTGATGTLVMPSAGPDAGQMYCITAATITPRTNSEGGGGTSFVISSLASGACPGTSVTASLDGCAAP